MSEQSNHLHKPPVPGPVGRLISRVYLMELARRNRRYDRGVGVENLGVPVISVGNLSVGGTGKTPMVRLICQWLIEAGHHPCIAMRGYRSGKEGSDEAREYQETLDSVPIVAQPDRAAGVRTLLGNPSGPAVGVVVLDDGFQHRRLARDLDIVLLDATHDPFADRALPSGWLRETPQALKRAHAIVVTHAQGANSGTAGQLFEKALQVNPELIAAGAEHHWTGLRLVQPGAKNEELLPIEWLSGKETLVVCAIGNPSPFIAQARTAAGDASVQTLVLRDHDPYHTRTIERIVAEVRRTESQVILTTRKDLTKLRAHAHHLPVPLVCAELEMSLMCAETELRTAVLGACSNRMIR